MRAVDMGIHYNVAARDHNIYTMLADCPVFIYTGEEVNVFVEDSGGGLIVFCVSV